MYSIAYYKRLLFAQPIDSHPRLSEPFKTRQLFTGLS